jgi:hypothetical protein
VVHNNVLRHWHNWCYRREWIKRGRPRTYCPQAGRITKRDLEYANDTIEKDTPAIKATRKRFADNLEVLTR